MNKLLFLIKHYIKKKVISKEFLFANIFLLLCIILLFNIDSIIYKLGGKYKEPINIILKDNAQVKKILEKEIDIIKKTNEDLQINIEESNDDINDIEENIKQNNKILIYITPSIDNYLDVTITSNNTISSTYYSALETAINNTKKQYALENYNLSKEELEEIEKDIEIKRVILNKTKTSTTDNNIILGVVVTSLLLPAVMLIIYLVQMIGISINEEKASHSMEIIISSVSVKYHFLSHIISANILIIIQSTLMIIYSLIALVVRLFTGSQSTISQVASTLNSNIIDTTSSISTNELLQLIDRIPQIIGVAIIMIVLSFIAYSLLAAILSSMTTSIEDFNNIEGPIMSLVFGGFYISLLAGIFTESTFLKILSFIPFISVILTPTLYALGDITIYHVLLSIILLIIVIYLLIKYGMNVYREGILNYDNSHIWKKIFKSFTNNNSINTSRK